ncbi:MAG: hypothetical protein MPW16_00255 [Candidatus Manganitrophus sp.]|nr:MAG: hypothetical protein MPW16_00255 [Candidatus Manganitrophus sp.]
MAFYHQKYRREAVKLKPEIKAAVVYDFLEKVQVYSEKMIDEKWKGLKKKKGRDLEAMQKLAHWIQYHRFNQIALEEIKEGTLDSWFKRSQK